MSGAKVDFTPEALREIDDAFERYLEGSLQAAEAFVREVDRAVALVASSPTIWPHFEAGTRRYVLRKFPYNIVYREIPVVLKWSPSHIISGVLDIGLGACVGNDPSDEQTAAFRDAADKLKNGDRNARFPTGSFPPHLPFVSAQPPRGLIPAPG